MAKWVKNAFRCPICDGVTLMNIRKPSLIQPAYVLQTCESCDSKFGVWIKLKPGSPGMTTSSVALETLSPAAAEILQTKKQKEDFAATKQKTTDNIQ